jgi:hypothetical protein
MGGSALLNEVDGNLCLWKRDAAVELHWQGKHRGAEFAPLMFEMKGVQSELVKDSKGRIMPTVMAVPLLEARAMQIAEMAVSMEDRLLLNIEANDAQSIRQRCVEITAPASRGCWKSCKAKSWSADFAVIGCSPRRAKRPSRSSGMEAPLSIQTCKSTVPNTVPSGMSGTALEQCSGTVFRLGTDCSRPKQLIEFAEKNPEQSWNSPKNRHSCPNSPRSLERGLEVDTVPTAQTEATQ